MVEAMRWPKAIIQCVVNGRRQNAEARRHRDGQSRGKLNGIPGISGVTTDQENTGPRLNVTVNREVASSFGILPATIDNTLDDAFGQRIVSTMYTALNQYHVVLEVDPRFQLSLDSLNNIYVSSSAGQQVPLSAVTNSAINAAPIVVNHQGMFPSTTISFNLALATSDAVHDACRLHLS